jgi:pterin-4a-carbinolamine dehydratase
VTTRRFLVVFLISFQYTVLGYNGSMSIHDDLALEWADIDGQGLVRVYPTTDFKSGFVFVAHIGMAAEQVEYYPEVLLTSNKLTVRIPENDDGLDHRLAHAIDAALENAVNT